MSDTPGAIAAARDRTPTPLPTPAPGKKRVLVYGGTGPTGIAIIEQLLEAGHIVLVYARNPDKLPDAIRGHHNARIIQGSLTDEEALKKPFELKTREGEKKKIDAIVSSLGPAVTRGPFQATGTPIAKGYKLIVGLAEQYGVRRIIILGTLSIPDAHDHKSLTNWALVNGVHLFAKGAYDDIVASGKVIRESALDWTIARVPILTTVKSSEYVAGYAADGKTGKLLSRAAYAEFITKEIEHPEWIGKQPLITSV